MSISRCGLGPPGGQLDHLEGEAWVGHTPCAEEENQLEVPLGRSVAVVHDEHPAAFADGGSRVAENCDEVIHEAAL